MATTPQFTSAGILAWGSLTAANTAYDGTGTVLTLDPSAGAAGAYILKITCKALGTNVASMCRIFLNNGSTNTTASNNSLIVEQAFAATTSSNTSALQEYNIPINIKIPQGYRILVTLPTAVASGWEFTLIGASY